MLPANMFEIERLDNIASCPACCSADHRLHTSCSDLCQQLHSAGIALWDSDALKRSTVSSKNLQNRDPDICRSDCCIGITRLGHTVIHVSQHSQPAAQCILVAGAGPGLYKSYSLRRSGVFSGNVSAPQGGEDAHLRMPPRSPVKAVLFGEHAHHVAG